MLSLAKKSCTARLSAGSARRGCVIPALHHRAVRLPPDGGTDHPAMASNKNALLLMLMTPARSPRRSREISAEMFFRRFEVISHHFRHHLSEGISGFQPSFSCALVGSPSSVSLPPDGSNAGQRR